MSDDPQEWLNQLIAYAADVPNPCQTCDAETEMVPNGSGGYYLAEHHDEGCASMARNADGNGVATEHKFFSIEQLAEVAHKREQPDQ